MSTPVLTRRTVLQAAAGVAATAAAWSPAVTAPAAAADAAATPARRSVPVGLL